MSQQQSLSADDVLRDIKQEMKRDAPDVPPLLEAIRQSKKRQQEFRNAPVVGSLLLLKELFFGLNRSTVLQQFEINELVIELLEDMYYEMISYQTKVDQTLTQLETSLKDGTSSSIQPYTNKSSDILDSSILHNIPSEMLMPERLLLYSLVYSLQPNVCLEIGTFRGGSALIICAAMDALDSGQIICIDPAPRITTDNWEKISHRTNILRSSSPEAIPQAAALSPKPFDFVLIDGDHSYEGVLKDIEGVLPFLSSSAYLLFHDSYYKEVEQAINQALKLYSHQLVDCGSLSVAKTKSNDNEAPETTTWGGLRLLRFEKSK